MDKINRYFKYALINGYECRFNGICTRRYPRPLLNWVNYINNFNTFQLPKQKASVMWVLLVITWLFKSVLGSIKRKWKWSPLLKQKVLFFLNTMSYIYAFVKSMNFIFIKCKELYLCFCWVNDLCCYCNVWILCFAKMKWKCMWRTFVFKFQLQKFNNFFYKCYPCISV